MKFLAIALTAALFPVAAHAESAADPVHRIMKVAEVRWATMEGDTPGYFDNLDRDFSKEFATIYREAEKYPVYGEGGSPFGYDVITNSQDGCPLKDVTITSGAETAGTTDVKVTFKLMSCFADDPGKDALSEVHFKVVTEDGKSVISDIDRIIDGKPVSLVAEMKDIVKVAREAPADQKEQQPQ